jgi:predicted phosphatase
MTEKELEKSMKIKEQRRSKAEMIKNFSLCDTLSTEIRGLIKEKHVLENERKVLQRKESQSKWFLKRKSALQTEGEKRNEQILLKRKPVSMTLESMWSRKKVSSMANDVVCLSSVVPRATPNQAEDDGDIEVLSPPVTSVTPNQAENDRDVEVLSPLVTSVKQNQAEDVRDIKVLFLPVTSVTPNQVHEDDRDIEILSPPVTSVTPNQAEDDGDIEVLSTPVTSVTPNKAEDKGHKTSTESEASAQDF